MSRHIKYVSTFTLGKKWYLNSWWQIVYVDIFQLSSTSACNWKYLAVKFNWWILTHPINFEHAHRFFRFIKSWNEVKACYSLSMLSLSCSTSREHRMSLASISIFMTVESLYAKLLLYCWLVRYFSRHFQIISRYQFFTASSKIEIDQLAERLLLCWDSKQEQIWSESNGVYWPKLIFDRIMTIYIWNCNTTMELTWVILFSIFLYELFLDVIFQFIITAVVKWKLELVKYCVHTSKL